MTRSLCGWVTQEAVHLMFLRLQTPLFEAWVSAYERLCERCRSLLLQSYTITKKTESE